MTAQRDGSPDGSTVTIAPERNGSMLDCLMCTWNPSAVLCRSLPWSERSSPLRRKAKKASSMAAQRVRWSG